MLLLLLLYEHDGIHYSFLLFFISTAINSIDARSLTQICMYGHTYSKGEDQPGKVVTPARGQLNRENDFFPVPVRAREFALARRVRQSRSASACSSPYSG